MLPWPFRKRRNAAPLPPPAPGRKVEVVGDIHGRADLLGRLPALEAGAIRVYVGDYVDRGPDSRAVLERLFEESRAGKCQCLLGNHEAMMLEFLEAPAASRGWLRHGGLQTLSSFGIGGIREGAPPDELAEVSAALAAQLPPDIRDWLVALPTVWTSGTLAVAHAGLDPDLPVDAQSREIALWGCPQFANVPRQDGMWVVHGHTIVPAPRVRNGVIAIDTGAYATGRLTMAMIDTAGAISFQTAGDG